MNRTTRRLVTGGGFVLAVLAAATGFEAIRHGHAEPVPAAAPAAITAAQAPGGEVVSELSQAFRRATQAALPAVVSIEVEAQRPTVRGSQFRGLPYFEDLPRMDPQPSRGQGTGFVFRADGYILTNNHVVDGATRITVRFQDSREMAATVVGRDPNTDIAIVKVDATDLATVDMGDSDQADVGDWVVALGYPLQLGSTATVTAGIVSAKGRDLNILDRNSETGGVALEHFIQTDAAINPGNSGGPLVDLNGRVIGVNSAIASPTGFYSGYGFAVPVNIAKRVADDLIAFGEVRRPRLGIGVMPVSEADKDILKLANLEGARVSQVEPGLPAAKAGIELGDVIVSVDDHPIRDAGQLTALLAERYRPGQKVNLAVVRYGKRMNIEAELATFEPAVTAARTPERPRSRGVSMLGFQATELTPQVARQLNIQADDGVVITDIDPAGSARGFVGPGTVIEQINGKAVKTLQDLDQAAQQVKPGDAVSLIVRTPDGRRTMVNYRIRS